MRLRAATLAIIAVLGLGAVARAAPFTVTTDEDAGAGSLRQAVSDANDSPDDDTITFALPANSTIALQSSLEAIESDTLIFATDATTTNLTIDGDGLILFQNASTSHDVTFAGEVTYTDGSFVFKEASAGTIAGELNGNDVVLTKNGVGTTTLNGTIALDDASDVNIDEGTFAMNGALSAGKLAVAAPATLRLISGTINVTDLTDKGTVDVDGALTTSSLLVESGGTLTVDGTVDVAGTLTNQGTVFANGSLTAGSLIVDSQGTLAGAGGSVIAPLTVRGRVAPSTSAGSLDIQGPVSFESTSTFEVDIAPGNVGDRLAVTGAVTIQPGAQLVLVADPTAIGTSSTVRVLSGGSISGQFISTDYAFFSENLNYQPTFLDVTLTSTGQSFSPFARTPNQLAVAEYLDAQVPTASGDFQTVLDTLNTALAGEIPPLLDAIGGESLTAFATARQILGERTARALHRRARDLAWGEGRAFYLSQAEAPDVAAGAEADPTPRDPVRAGAWLDGLGLFGELEGNTGEADVDTLLYGGTLGADAWIAERVVIGLAAGYARSDVDLDHREADVFGDTVQGALYAGFIDPRGYVSAYGRYAYTFQDSSRAIESSALLRHAHADWNAQDYGAGGEAGVTLVSLGGFALQPIAGIDWLRLTEESYTESGAGSLGLTVDPETLDSTTARFGGRVFGRFDMDGTGTLVPELRAFYQHLYGDRERVLEARLSGAPGLTSIGVRGPKLPRENWILGVGWGVMVSEHLTVSFDYDAVLGSDRVEHQGNIAARVVF